MSVLTEGNLWLLTPTCWGAVFRKEKAINLEQRHEFEYQLCHVLACVTLFCKIEIILNTIVGFCRTRIDHVSGQYTVLCIFRHKEEKNCYWLYFYGLLFSLLSSTIYLILTALQWASSIIKKPGVWESLISIICHICTQST